MDRDIALRLDGRIWAICGSLDGLAAYMKENLPQEEFAKLVKSIGQSMAALMDISQAIYAQHPDIVPDELRPTNVE